MSRRPFTTAALVVAVAFALVGCTDQRVGTSAGPTPLAPGAGVAEPSDSPSPSPSLSPSVSPSPSKPPAPTYDVKAVQTRLTTLKYYIGAIDGRPGSAQRSAVMAFQKVNGLPVNGVVDNKVLAALDAPKAPQLKATSPANRVEVDLTRQVLYVVKGGVLERVMPVSSGNGKRYRQKSGSLATALTPVGWYKIERRIVGKREADLGTLYDPQYFYRGWAIHGSNSVPAREASHGCVRITRADAKWMLSHTNVGMDVYVYGGRHTFEAGSSAPGTDNPSGDEAEASPSPSPSPTPSSSPSGIPLFPPSPTPSGSPSDSPSPTPSASASS